VAGAPQVGRDQAIGRHGHSKGNQKLKKKHGEGDPGSGPCWEANLTSLESSTSEDRLHFVVHCPRKREEEGESPDDGKSPVAISELSSYTQWCRNHLEWFGKVSNFKSFKYQVNFRLRELKELIKYLFLFMYFLRIHAFVFNIIDQPGIYPLQWLSWCKRRQTQRHSE